MHACDSSFVKNDSIAVRPKLWRKPPSACYLQAQHFHHAVFHVKALELYAVILTLAGPAYAASGLAVMTCHIPVHAAYACNAGYFFNLRKKCYKVFFQPTLIGEMDNIVF